jgi:extracellular factor (EF) 3-hydroxypalmitic acid methyl ester biosynthesis protein
MSRANNGSSNGHTPAQPAEPSRRPPVPLSLAAESMVNFTTTEGVKLCGAPVRLTKLAAAFEVHGGGSALRLSEAIPDFEITSQRQTVYSGRARISNLMDGGSKMIGEVSLEETGWTHALRAGVLENPATLNAEVARFFQEWQGYYKISNEFKVAIADIHSFLTESQIWLDRLEMAAQGQHADILRLAEQLELRVLTSIRNLTDRVEEILQGVAPEFLPSHRIYCRRILHPLTLASPFMHRTFIKPLGYAGDHEMVAMMFRNRFQGESLFARLLNSYALHLPPVVAHRNRIEYLVKQLQEESLRFYGKADRLRVFNLGCGPAQEVQFFMERSELSNHVDFTLADFNQETVERTNRILQENKTRHHRRTGIKTIRCSVQQLLKDSLSSERRGRLGHYDFIYCAGLFDYLADSTCRQLMDVFFEMLKPGGLLVATNVDNHEARHQQECFLDWQLIYRDHKQLQSVGPEKADPQNITLRRDASGVNVFLEVRK